ncbi:MAG: pre-peptidase C-terminal domain-containing protein [bacterium]|nr:pre-peptidase C-terminal domain-containing protein [bacterium]
MKNLRRVLFVLCSLWIAMPLLAQEAGTPSVGTATVPVAATDTAATPSTVAVSPSPSPIAATATPTAVTAATAEATISADAGARLVTTAQPSPTPTSTPIPVFPLQAGSIEGNINDAIPLARYSFTGSRDEGVAITMDTTSGSLDPFVILYGPDGSQIASNDDRAPGERNAAISISLPASGTYTIEATRFSQGETLSTGTFRLTLTRSNVQPTGTPGDPLAERPNFGVPYTVVAYQDLGTGRIVDDQPLYFAFVGQQGDLVRLILSRTSGDLLPRLRIYDDQRREIGRDAQTRDSEAIIYATLPQTGWYLIEATRRASGNGSAGSAGTFDLFVNRLANAILQVGEQVTGNFTAETSSLTYIVNARLGDQISATMFTVDANAGIQPALDILDLGLRPLEGATGERFVTARTTIPRSAPYLLRVTNRNPSAMGAFNLRLSSIPVNQAALVTRPLGYNDQTEGLITSGEPLDLYRFSGKTGELVTITMSAASVRSALDSYLILMDGDLNELAANDDTSASRDARIAQFRLPKDGDYLILASRSGLAGGTTAGSYQLALTAGEIRLTNGALSASLDWASPADLNLFVRDPQGRTITWSSPNAPSGGALQIDSNTGCSTPSDQPVEHIYWPSAPPPGDYVVWAWYQDGCGQSAPTAFSLTLRVNGEPLIVNESLLNIGERLETTIRLTATGEAFVVDSGAITLPSPQQTVSEGGDPVIRFGDVVEAEITDAVYARFYQFSGNQGERVRITAERLTGDLDALILLRNAADQTLPDGLNDDADDSTRDAALTYTLPYTGQYVIAVTRYGVRDGTTLGRYRLSVQRVVE